MKKRILLHVGSPKCGSTYLQQVMLQNAARLEAADVRYPHDGGTHPGNAADLATIDRATLDRYFDGGMRTVILSHEDLYGQFNRGKALVALAQEEKITVQVLAFLRPFSEFVYGDYSQFMKQFFEQFLAERAPYGGRDFEAFALRRINTMKPAAYLRRWHSQFPQRPLVLARHHNIRKVLTRVLHWDLDADSLNWDVATARTNRSLRMEDCDRIAAAMRDPDIPANRVRALFREAFVHTDAPDAGKTDARTLWLEEQFAPQNDELEKAFGFDNRHRLVKRGARSSTPT